MPTFDKSSGKFAAFVFGALSLLLLCPSAFATDPSLDVSQYAHTAWHFREDFTQGVIKSIAQTPDGYIWLGTGFGLFRFDGVRVERWQPPLNGEQLPSNFVINVRVGRDGTLWIGTMNGLASWKNGRLVRYPALSGLIIASILEDHKGTVWVAGNYSLSSPGKLCAIDGTNVGCDGSGDALGHGISGLYEDSHDVLWVVTRGGIWRWRPGPPKFYRVPFGRFWVQDVVEAGNEALLIPLPGRLARLERGKLETQIPFPAEARNVEGVHILRDRDGGIWIGTAGAGVVHVHQGRTDVFSQADGLSGEHVNSIFEDREGDVWVATADGLDRFRNYAIATYAQHQGMGTAPGWGSVVAGADGTIWMGTSDGLREWNHGDVTIYGRADGHNSKTIWPAVRYVADPGLPDHGPVFVFEENSGGILVSTPSAFGHMEAGRFVSIRGVPGGTVSSASQDTQGNLWIANEDRGLVRSSSDGTVQQISWASIGHKDAAQSLAAGRSNGGLWIGFDGGGVSYFSDGQIKKTYGFADGLGSGRVSALHIDNDDTVWAATEGGLSRIRDGRVLTLSSKNGLPCDAIYWITEGEHDSIWLNTTCGLVRIMRDELNAWVADSQRQIKTTVLDGSDGVTNAPIAFHAGTQVTLSPDGKIWFQGFSGGASVIDPRHLPTNTITPPVHIERITANGETYNASNGLRLPPRIRDLKIDYTALSFVAPEKVQIRYQLERQDHAWREVANKREVQYSNLAPGNYVFRVTAANNSGVWNEAGDTLNFSIAPTYYETNWFRATCVAAVLVLVWFFFRLRMQQVQRRFNAGLEARVSERTRIARELHDTLLQSLHGLMFQYQAARNMLPREPDGAAVILDSAIGATEQTITDSRGAIQHLRSATDEGDLEQWLTATGQELGRLHAADGDAPVFRSTAEGERKTLSALPRDEIFRIAREILRNAFQHAQASRIEVEIRYDDREFRLRIRDDGKGVESGVLQQDGTAGHWGVRGARERAQQIGARLDFWSEAGAGTEVELTVPAAIAYEKAKERRRFSFFRKA